MVTTSAATTPATTAVVTRIRYGDDPHQFGDLTVVQPRPSPVVVLIHGGFWRTPYDLDLMEPLAADLSIRGYAVWNISYRRIGDDGGGWPGTLDDVANAVDALAHIAADHPIDLRSVAVIGHSAGGHLALWAAGREAPAVTPAIAIAQGAVVDLDAAAQAGLGDSAVIELLGGGPDEVPDRYELATPHVGGGRRVVSVVGTADTIVPPAFSVDPDQRGDLELVEIDGADHFDLIDPTHEAWSAVVDRLDRTIAPTAR